VGIVGATVVAVLVASCGGEGSRGDERSDRSRIAVLVDTTEAADSARVVGTMYFSTPGDELSSLETRIEGLVDFANDRGRAVIETSSAEMPEGQRSGRAHETRWFGPRQYERGGPALSESDKEWVVIDFDEVVESFPCFGEVGGFDPSFGLGGGANPGDVLTGIAEAGGSLVEVGSEQVRGEPTTHWRVEIDPDNQSAPPAQCGELPDNPASQPSIPEFEVWTDEAGRARRITVTSSATNGDPSIVHTIEFFDFGIDVDVDEPPASDVADETREFLRLIRGPGEVASWNVVATGDAPAWKLWYGKSSTDVRCYDAEWADGRRPEGALLPEDGSTPTHNGRSTECLLLAPVVAIIDSTDALRQIVVGAADDGYDVSVRLTDGSMKKLAVEGDERVFRWESEFPIAATTIVATADDNTYECSLGTVFSGPPDTETLMCSRFGPTFAG
jgi:hypothetical protein